MTRRIVPLPTEDETLRQQESTLDGQTFVLTFDWSAREDRWYLQVADTNGTTLISGIKLVPRISLLRNLSNDTRPAGELRLYTTDDVDPTRTTIDQATLIYIPAADL